MDQRSVRCVVLDVEGVLTPAGGSQEPWPLEALLAVRRRLQHLGAAVVLCTGRQVPYGEAVIQALGLFFPLPETARAHVRGCTGRDLLSWPSILENGAYFYDPVAKRPIPHPELTPGRIAALARLRSEVLQPLAGRTGAVLEAGKDFCLSLNPPPLAPGEAERMSTDAFRPEVDAAAREFLAEVEIKHSASAVDITPRGVSKASAVRLLLEWTGLAPEEVLGVGDTAADGAWLQGVGWRAAPANGRAALPGMHYYARAEATEGLLEIMERLAERRLRGLD